MCLTLAFDLDVELALFDNGIVDDVEELQYLGIAVFGVLDYLFEYRVGDGLHVDLRIEPQAECPEKDRRKDLSLP